MNISNSFLNSNSDKMDINEDKINKNKNYKQNKLVFMDIVVEPGMCQGVYFNKSNDALKCTKKAKYCKNNRFKVCENHKNQCFGN